MWFGRDVFGRRSLLWHLPQATEGDDCLAISSVGYYDPTSTPVVSCTAQQCFPTHDVCSIAGVLAGSSGSWNISAQL